MPDSGTLSTMTTSFPSGNHAANECVALLDWLAEQGVAQSDFPPGAVLARLIAGPTDKSSTPKPGQVRPHRVPRVLMVFCQKLGSTGSGIVIKEIADRADVAGAEYGVLCGGYAGDDPARLFANQPSYLETVNFKSESEDGLPFPIVGMSNRMPYESIAFRDLAFADLETYLGVWSAKIRKTVGAFQPDIIHVHHLWLLAAVAALEMPDLPVVVSVHGTDLHRAEDSPHLECLVGAWANRFARVLTLTAESVPVIRSRYRCDEGVFAVCGNGFNQELFHPWREVRSDVLQRYGIPSLSKRKVILSVAKYDQRKGIEWLIRAYAKLPQSEIEPSLLLIAGSGPPDERRRYVSVAAELGVRQRVVLTGAVEYPHVGILMNLASVFALPSYHEPFGLAVLEALACGCRVVTTDQSGPPSFIPQELKGRGDAILVPGLRSPSPDKREAEWFLDSLTKALATQLAKPIGQETRQEISASVQHLSWDSYVGRLGDIYHQLARERRQ